MMRFDVDHWVADSWDDLKGWEILTCERWKEGVQRVQVVKRSTEGAESRTVYVTNPRRMRMYFMDPCDLTATQFHQMQKDVQARISSGPVEPGDMVLLQLLREHGPRYKEITE